MGILIWNIAASRVYIESLDGLESKQAEVVEQAHEEVRVEFFPTLVVMFGVMLYLQLLRALPLLLDSEQDD